MELKTCESSKPGEENSGESLQPSKPRENRLLEPALLAGIILLTFICYAPVLFNFFNGDDFVHLSWLSRAINHPELVWRNFYTSWLDGTTTKFYRPLISVFMVSDYALWGVNGLGFRLTNIAFHLSSSIFIFFIAMHIQAGSLSPKRSESSERAPESDLTWPLSAAALFALYPLHPEAVSWITGRVDSVVTAFCLAAIFFYMKYRGGGGLPFLSLSLLASVLGLLSKEMAITLPAVCFLYEIVFSAGNDADRTLVRRFAAVIFHALLKTLPFWLLLAVYFAVRYLALGTLVGGYDDSLLFVANLPAFLSGWKHALITLFVPINKSLVGSHHILGRSYPLLVIAAAAAAVFSFCVSPSIRRAQLFIMGWLVLCLIPVYKLFSISDDLQGSRLAYLATAPVCMLLTSCLLKSAGSRCSALWLIARRVLMFCLISLAGILLWINNQPWKMAGEENNAIRSSLQLLYGKIQGDPQVMFLGLPDQIDGAYTCRNSLDGMVKRPQLNRDIVNCLMVNAFEPILPFGYLKESIAENRNSLLIYRWQSEKKSFTRVEVEPPATDYATESWSGERLKSIVSVPEQGLKPAAVFKSDGSVELLSSGRHPQFVEFDLGSLPCFRTDFVELELQLSEPAKSGSGADLQYSNDMYPDFELRRRARGHFEPGKTLQHVLFPLRGLPEWSLGGQTHSFRLLLPLNSKLTLRSISVPPAQSVMPKLSFKNSGYFGSKGYLHLSPSEKEGRVYVDLEKIAGAVAYALEITRANLLFEEQNTRCYSNVAQKLKIKNERKGHIVLKADEFKSPGIYELRVFPLSADGNVCGASSDHIVIAVGP